MPRDRAARVDPVLTLVYDGTCPLCQRAAAWIEGHTPAGAVDLLSCSDPARAERFPWMSEEDCMRAAWAVRRDGSRVAGEEALLEVLLLAPGWHWVARALRLPLVRALTPALYRWFARNRHALAAFVPGSRHKDDENDKEESCSE